jgi:hypothetical protein
LCIVVWTVAAAAPGTTISRLAIAIAKYLQHAVTFASILHSKEFFSVALRWVFVLIRRLEVSTTLLALEIVRTFRYPILSSSRTGTARCSRDQSQTILSFALVA